MIQFAKFWIIEFANGLPSTSESPEIVTLKLKLLLNSTWKLP